MFSKSVMTSRQTLFAPSPDENLVVLGPRLPPSRTQSSLLERGSSPPHLSSSFSRRELSIRGPQAQQLRRPSFTAGWPSKFGATPSANNPLISSAVAASVAFPLAQLRLFRRVFQRRLEKSGLLRLLACGGCFLFERRRKARETAWNNVCRSLNSSSSSSSSLLWSRATGHAPFRTEV